MLTLCKILQLILGANFDAYAANASSADVLEMLFHIPRAFFRIKIALPVRGGQFAVDCTRRTSLLTKGTVSATVFDDGQFALHGAVGEYGGKTNLTAVVGG